MEQEPEPEAKLLPEGEEDYGGPVKPFLDHLEDLRWMLIKVVVAVLMGMIVSLVAGKQLVAFLTWPLDHAEISASLTNKPVPWLLSSNVVGRVPRTEMQQWFGTNDVAGLQMMPVMVGTNIFVQLHPLPQAELDTFSIREIRLNTYSPIEGILIALRLALYGGLVLSAPFVIYFIGSFVLPALKLTEKKLLYQIVGFGSFLFFLGVAFCYFIIMQVALLATVQFSSWLGFVADEWRADAYISFVSKFMLGMGISFQLPVVLLTLVKVGLLDYQKLSRFRTYWVVVNLVICAFATPSGDPVTMLTMAVPLHILYEISVFIAWLWRPKPEPPAA